MNTISFTKSLRALTDLVVVTIAVEFIPWCSGYAANHLAGYFDTIDPEHAFAWNFLHHITQLILGLGAMKLYSWKRPLGQWGFNLHDRKWSLNVFIKFTIAWVLFWSLGAAITFMLSGGAPTLFNHSMSLRNIAGNLSFMLLMPGPSEETLFRGFVMGVLLSSWKGSVHFGKVNLSTAGIIAALLFAYAHIGYTVSPFQIYSLNPMQLCMAFGLGLFYAYTFEKTGSLLCPILSHSASDFLGNGILYVLKAFMRG